MSLFWSKTCFLHPPPPSLSVSLFHSSEDNDEKKLLAEQLLQDIIGKLTEDDVGQEEDYAPSYAGELEEEEEEEEEESILDAGMVDEEIEYDAREKEEEGVFAKEKFGLFIE